MAFWLVQNAVAFIRILSDAIGIECLEKVIEGMGSIPIPRKGKNMKTVSAPR